MRLTKLSDAQFDRLCERLDGETATRADLRAATIHLLALLEDRAPGASVEVRIPPYGVAQCVSGSRHTRGTPPAVVEMDAQTWVDVARGKRAWSNAAIDASGERSDLMELMPLV